MAMWANQLYEQIAEKAPSIIERLKKCVSGELLLSPTQVSAASVLLHKVIPDLTIAGFTLSGHARRTGIYFLIREGEIVYVGQTTNLFARLAQHIADPIKQFDSFQFFDCSEHELLKREAHFIELYAPEYNVVGKNQQKSVG